MSTPSKQSHKLLAIPGPVELTDEVLQALAQPPVSHVSPQFVAIFRDCIEMTRKVVGTKDGQPFIISGSGTFGWDQVAANLVEPGEDVLVLHTGYFGDGFRDCLRTYGANVDELKAKSGFPVELHRIESALMVKRFKAITITHVDTSTGVLSDVKAIADIVRRISPDTLIIVDGVCSVASEEIQMDTWGVDVVLTASQKGLGAPPGLSILIASQRAIQVFAKRRSPVTSYYASWKKWLPIMTAYGNNKPAYFGTPAVNLIKAYHASLTQITSASPSLNERLRLHKQVSQRIKAIAEQLGLRQLPQDPAHAANGMTALYLPDGIGASDILPRLAAKGVVMAGGLGDSKDKYIRIGHMGTSVVDATRGDIDTIASTLQVSLKEAQAAKK
ncbi:Alanine--glyoxylate aminotransferase 1 [Hypsizygus marmoreus]|uniref:alanine--glyoxylate transaminase n=1 Tax=Hypsizygus marmoreus TaxID=39966 RepID=A0A369JTX3_HYPMA|nr:Alanine--glyoxylate aminotransferase 1 [Hypsizygus marmoreus]